MCDAPSPRFLGWREVSVLVCWGVLASGCSANAPHAASGPAAPGRVSVLNVPDSSSKTPTAASPAAQGSARRAPHYVVDATSLERLKIRVVLAEKPTEPLRVAQGGEPFVSDAQEHTAAGTWPLGRGEAGFEPTHCASGCELSYDFALAEAARQLGDGEMAEQFGSAWVAPSSSWLAGPPDQAGYSLEVQTTAPNVFLTALSPLDPNRPGVVGTDESPTIFAPFAGLGAWRTRSVRVNDAQFTIGIAGSGYATSDDELARWVEQTVTPMGDYYAGLPALRPLILVVPGDHNTHGVTLGNGGSSIMLRVGADVTSAEALAEWVPTHELIHVLFPSVAPRLPWIEEGLATYVEPIIRVRAGRVSLDQFWGELWRGLPQGLPEAGDQGLDRTRTWGRTYWGGCLFWFLTDVRIRERTQNQRSVRDALVAILHAGGNVSVDWSLERILALADTATQGHDFRDTYAQMATSSWAPDLNRLGADLGVSVKGRHVAFDDKARLASVRAGITH